MSYELQYLIIWVITLGEFIMILILMCNVIGIHEMLAGVCEYLDCDEYKKDEN